MRIDQAHDPAGTTHVQAGEGLAVRGQGEERVSGQHRFPVTDQPVVEAASWRSAMACSAVS